ncbi:ABC transporter B family member 5, putative [Plasmodium gallinaceum]|uniref:ABC transporter B family member 5, putative n=1 Tax=Plasmodium gallinaceum TaxID=5849 RepID=A0A1J1GVR3_PLAGA|nr:ABC transporter B family member 5, putative [Plasmodium gallinaceum]CRG95107.1 ABC transporter B family member 5, putative [Plasmodium gallinaceum]
MGNVLCKIKEVKNSLINSLLNSIKNFFKRGDKLNDKFENDSNKNVKIKNKNKNYIFRAICDMNKYEITLLSMALIFLAINAYTNLSYPKIMGECIESDNTKFMKYNFLNNMLQKTIFLKKFQVKTNNNMNALIYYIPYFACGGLASYFRIYFTSKCIKNVEYRLKKEVHNKIISENDEEFKKYKSSDYLVNCAFNEIKFASKELVTSITQMLRYVNSIIGGMISMVLISSYLTKLCIFIVPAYGFFVLMILKKLKNIRIQTDNFDEKQMARFSDILQKKNIVSIFGNEYYEKEYFSKKLKAVDKLHQKYLNCEATFYSFLNIGSNVVICSILCFGRMELKNNNITHGQLVSFIAYSSMLGLGIVGLLKLKKDLNILHLSLKKIYEILDFSKSYKANNPNDKILLNDKNIHNKNEKDDKKNFKIESINDDYNNGQKKSYNCNFNKNIFPENIKGSIKYENVSFSYNNFDENKKEVLKNINFEINENEKVAIIGKSGSGKSTLWKLLTREYEYEGNIYIDNYNIKDINETYFKKNVLSISEQECSILNRSLYENLIYGLLPVKIQDEKKTFKIIFENIDSSKSLYEKILTNSMEDKKETNKSLDTLTDKNKISLILQNCDLNESNYEYLREKFNSYLKSSIEEKNFFSEKEKEFINEKVQDIVKNIHCKNKNSCNTNKIIVNNTVDTDYNINNYTFLKDYKNKLNTINSSVNVLCEELDLINFINTLPQNFHTEIRHNSMSSGQKQRISIIRSLMKDTPIYVFDEITSFLDESNTEKVYTLINTLIPNKTIIYITHSIQLLKEMDKIIIVDNGEIKSIGSYDEVKKDPLFLDIFSMNSNKT